MESLTSNGNAFQSLGAAQVNDLSPSVTLHLLICRFSSKIQTVERTSCRFCFTSQTKLRKLLSQFCIIVISNFFSLGKELFTADYFQCPGPYPFVKFEFWRGSYSTVAYEISFNSYQTFFPWKASKSHIYLSKRYRKILMKYYAYCYPYFFGQKYESPRNFSGIISSASLTRIM